MEEKPGVGKWTHGHDYTQAEEDTPSYCCWIQLEGFGETQVMFLLDRLSCFLSGNGSDNDAALQIVVVSDITVDTAVFDVVRIVHRHIGSSLRPAESLKQC